MIKQFFHKSFSTLLALFVLFSTVSFTVEKHFCGDVLIDVGVFSEAQKCAMEAFEIEQEIITKKLCCKDELHIFQGQKELNRSSFDDLEFQQQLFIASFTYTFVNLFEGLAEQIIPHKNYFPPNLIANIQVLDQVFII